MQMFLKILVYCSYFSVVLPLILFFNRRPVETQKALIVLSYLLIVAGLSDLTCFIMNRMGISNIVVVNAYFIIQFCLLSYMYSLILKNMDGLIGLFVSITLSFSFFNSLLNEPFTDFQSHSDGLQSLFLIVLAIICHIQMLKNPSRDVQFTSLVLWVNLGVLFYFSLNFYLFVSSYYIFTYESVRNAMITWGFHNFFNIAKNVLFAIGIYNYTKLEFRRNKDWKEQHY